MITVDVVDVREVDVVDVVDMFTPGIGIRVTFDPFNYLWETEQVIFGLTSPRQIIDIWEQAWPT
jgi:hypothetical protein